MNRCGGIILLMIALSVTGCVVVDVGVTNPNPGISTVAIAPFFNQSSEKAVDGRRFALAYFSELQKTPGYQVVPVGVTETVIIKYNLKMASPQDVLKLAEILNVDAVVIGTVTDYDPYYPPRIGMHVEWYSPQPAIFEPGIQIDPGGRKQIRHSIKYEDSDPEFHRRRRFLFSKVPLVLRGQSQSTPESNLFGQYQQSNIQNNIQLIGIIEQAEDGLIQPTHKPSFKTPANNETPVSRSPVSKWFGYTNKDVPYENRSGQFPKLSQETSPSQPDSTNNTPKKSKFPKIRLADFTRKLMPSSINPFPNIDSKPGKQRDKTTKVALNSNLSIPVLPPPIVVVQQTPLKPMMSYTRIFEGSDADLTATLRNYLELNGDARSGNWEATMQRSEDFIRFTCHLMIREMLTLHGGEARRRIVLKYRKYK